MIRDARPGDYARFAELFPELGVPVELPSEKEWLENLMASTLVLDERGRIIAYAVGSAANKPKAHLGQIVVDPGERGRGHGKTIMLAMGTRLYAEGCVELGLHVKKTNEIGRRLYRSLGLVETFSSVWVELAWSARAALPLDPWAPSVRLLRPERDSWLESKFGLGEGRLAYCRKRPEAVLVELFDEELRAPVGLGALSGRGHMVSPLRVRSSGDLRALLDALSLSACTDSVYLVLDDHDALVEELLTAGGTIVLDTFHMVGDLAGAIGEHASATFGNGAA